MSMAADSWLAFMDRLLMLRGDEVDGMHSLKGKMLHLVDIYYDALDAPKSGKKVSFNLILPSTWCLYLFICFSNSSIMIPHNVYV